MSRSGEDAGFSQICPRCGQELTDPDPARVADLVVAHAETLTSTGSTPVVLAHLQGVRPDELDD